MKTSLSKHLNAGRGLISRKSAPELAGVIDWSVRTGELTSVLPGIYARTELAADLRTRARAVMLADPRAVITGFTAGHLHGWWDATDCLPIEVCATRLAATDWLRPSRRSIVSAQVVTLGRIRCTSKAMTAIDLIPELGADAVELAQRQFVSLAGLPAALEACPGRPGNRLRRDVLEASGTRPWSKAERLVHRALQLCSVSGWVANHPIQPQPVERPIAVLDLAFIELLLNFEIDGAENHDNADSFRRDRIRDQRLAGLGWQVIRIPASQVFADVLAVVRDIEAICRVRAAQLAIHWP